MWPGAIGSGLPVMYDMLASGMQMSRRGVVILYAAVTGVGHAAFDRCCALRSAEAALVLD